jgi:DNA-binding NarL/FixJ family response regulator
MARVALIQSLFRVLTYPSSEELHGFQAQIYDNFYEALEAEYNHTMQIAKTLDDYQQKDYAAPDIVICAPLAEEGNPAPGLAELRRIRDNFPATPIIVWSTRKEESLRKTCLEDLGCAAYYTGTLLDAPEELPRIIAEAL